MPGYFVPSSMAKASCGCLRAGSWLSYSLGTKTGAAGDGFAASPATVFGWRFSLGTLAGLAGAGGAALRLAFGLDFFIAP